MINSNFLMLELAWNFLCCGLFRLVLLFFIEDWDTKVLFLFPFQIFSGILFRPDFRRRYGMRQRSSSTSPQPRKTTTPWSGWESVRGSHVLGMMKIWTRSSDSSVHFWRTAAESRLLIRRIPSLKKNFSLFLRFFRLPVFFFPSFSYLWSHSTVHINLSGVKNNFSLYVDNLGGNKERSTPNLTGQDNYRKNVNFDVNTKQSLWVETGVFSWRVKGGKFCLRFLFNARFAHAACHCFNTGTVSTQGLCLVH